MDNFTLIKKELKINGINVDNCFVIINSKKYNINNYISVLLKKIQEQKYKLKLIFNQLQQQLKEMPLSPHQHNMIDDLKYNLFIFALSDLNRFCKCFNIESQILAQSIKKDIYNFSKQLIYSVPDYRMAIQISFRKIQKHKHNINMLEMIRYGKNVANNKYKIAGGIQGVVGPMSNLNYPLGQRIYPWRQTGQQFQGKSNDTQNQTRYKLGLQNYNKDGSVGEGFYMRDLKGEPFEWKDRHTDSPTFTMRDGTYR